MIRLDVCTLKTVLRRSKESLRSEVMEEESRFLATHLWTLTTSIVRRVESDGFEAIRLMEMLACFDSPKIILSLPNYQDEISILRNYDLIDVQLTNQKTKLTLHSGLMEGIRERNRTNEMIKLKWGLETTKELKGTYPGGSQVIDLRSTWGNALKYPELVKEFKHFGFHFCNRNYQLQFLGNGDMDNAIEQRTREVYTLVFGETDDAVIHLICLELELSVRTSHKNLLDMCQQFHPVLLEHLGKMGYKTSNIWNIEREILKAVISRKCFSKKLIAECLGFCSSAYNIYLGKRDLYSALKFFKLIVLYQAELQKTSDVLDIFLRFRGCVVNEFDFASKFNLFAPESLHMLYFYTTSLSETALDLTSSKSAKNSRHFKVAMIQEFIIPFKTLFEYISMPFSLEPAHRLFIANKFPDFVINLINHLAKLGAYDEILSITKMNDSVVKQVLQGHSNEPGICRYHINAIIGRFIDIHRTIFSIGTTKRTNRNWKFNLLNSSITGVKDLFTFYLRYNPYPYSDNFNKHELPLRIIKCYMHLNLFQELVEYLNDYEKLLEENCSGDSYEIAKGLIEFAALVVRKLDKFIPRKRSEFVELLKVIELTISNQLQIILEGEVDCTSSAVGELVNSVISTTKLCRIYQKCFA